eukprot:752429-Hanusia_phi.AAC.3
MCKYASWATGCRQHIVGKDQARNSEVHIKSNLILPSGDSITASNFKARKGLPSLQSPATLRATFQVGFGRKCKRLIDVGRMLYVREHLGLECELSAYVAEDLTPENVMLIAS